MIRNHRCAVPMALAMGLAAPAWADDNAADWPSYNRTLLGDRYAPQTAISPRTAKRLRRLCEYDLGRQSSFQTGPLVIGGTLFITTDIDTIAIDGATCAEKWRITENYTPAAPLLVNRGAAYAEGRIFRGTEDARVLAYQASNGRRLWEVTLGDRSLGESVPAALITWQGLLFAGNAGGDNRGVKGRMYAIDAATGQIVWEQYLVPREAKDKSYGPPAPAPQLAADSWGSIPGIPISGGAPWTSYSLDPSNGALYVPGGNPAPDFARHFRPGVDPYSGTLVVLDAHTGAVRAAYPLVPNDFHDWDVSAAPALFTTRAGVRLAAEAIKDGYVYGIDRTTGERRWKVATTTIADAAVPLSAAKPTHFCPGTYGGTEWNGAAYSPRTNFVYVGAIDWCTTVTLATDEAIKAAKPGVPWFGARGQHFFGEPDPLDQSSGWITAVDADSGAVVWKRHLPSPVLAAVTPTAGGVVFVADMGGNVYALNDTTGATLWQTRSQGAVGGGIVSYAMPSGAQRIAVATGMVSPIWPVPKVNASVIVYGLADAQKR